MKVILLACTALVMWSCSPKLQVHKYYKDTNKGCKITTRKGFIEKDTLYLGCPCVYFTGK